MPNLDSLKLSGEVEEHVLNHILLIQCWFFETTLYLTLVPSIVQLLVTTSSPKQLHQKGEVVTLGYRNTTGAVERGCGLGLERFSS